MLITILISCGSDQKELACANCRGPHLSIYLNPPVKESIEVELEPKDENTTKISCPLFSPGTPISQKTSSNLEKLDGHKYALQGICYGDVEKLPPKSSSNPILSSPENIFLSPSPVASTYTTINTNKLVVYPIKTKLIKVTVKKINGDILGQQTFSFDFESNSNCGNRFPNCSDSSVTLNLSKPTEPTPTPSNTPSP
jgi:hypothetical protein